LRTHAYTPDAHTSTAKHECTDQTRRRKKRKPRRRHDVRTSGVGCATAEGAHRVKSGGGVARRNGQRQHARAVCALERRRTAAPDILSDRCRCDERTRETTRNTRHAGGAHGHATHHSQLNTHHASHTRSATHNSTHRGRTARRARHSGSDGAEERRATRGRAWREEHVSGCTTDGDGANDGELWAERRGGGRTHDATARRWERNVRAAQREHRRRVRHMKPTTRQRTDDTINMMTAD
jgi:hypothetical protein